MYYHEYKHAFANYNFTDSENRGGQVIILHRHKSSSSVLQEPVITPVTEEIIEIDEPVVVKVCV